MAVTRKKVCGYKKPNLFEKQCGCKKDNSCSTSCDTSCGCKTTLETMCVFYNELEHLTNIDTKKGDNLSEILKKINDIISELKEVYEQGSIIASIGEGYDIYKGVDEEGVNLIKSLLESDSINIIDSDEELQIVVDEEWISELITSNEYLKDIIEGYLELINKNKSDISEIITDISEIRTQVSNINQEITSILNEVNLIKNAISNLSNNISNNTQSISTLNNKINEIIDVTNEAGVIEVEEFTGQHVMELGSENILDVLQVTYCGAVLPKDGYVLQNGNQVKLMIGKYGLDVEGDESIQVMYRKGVEIQK